MKRKDEVRRSSSWETAYGRMENRGAVRRPAALPAHVERLAKALGVEVVVEERLQPAVKGYIQGNAIHLPPSSPDAAMEILRHELTHRMQELSPRQYGKYRDYVIRQYTAADAAAKYEAYRRAGHPLTPEQVVDELVAEYAGRHLREEGAIRRLAGENRTLAEWVRGSIRALAERIREKLGQAEPTLEHAQRLWERAFRAAEQHASRQNPSVPLPGPEPPARYSIREEIDSSHSEEYTGENAGKGDSETKLDTGKWNKGSHENAEKSLQKHFYKHGEEVGAKNPQQYLRKAEEFAKHLKGAKKAYNIHGETPNVTKYYKNGKYIDLALDGTIISFGKQ